MSDTNYRKMVRETANSHFRDKLDQLVNGALGLCGEGGEVADIVKKVIYQGHPFDVAIRDKLIKEIGDVRWYLELMAVALDVTMEEVEIRNTAKLRSRYPDGFSTERSLNRIPDGIGG